MRSRRVERRTEADGRIHRGRLSYLETPLKLSARTRERVKRPVVQVGFMNC
ncbi:hypothetical protein BN903_221 [Halorubrum sp. AJ67]|nr:hypothetical protein BN903_221 [Halorubrum sp. AJ67]